MHSLAAKILKERRHHARVARKYALIHGVGTKAYNAYMFEWAHWTLAAKCAEDGDMSARPFFPTA